MYIYICIPTYALYSMTIKNKNKRSHVCAWNLDRVPMGTLIKSNTTDFYNLLLYFIIIYYILIQQQL